MLILYVFFVLFSDFKFDFTVLLIYILFWLVQLKGADPTYLTELVQRNAGPNPPVAPLPVEAETAKVAGNVGSSSYRPYSDSTDS